MPVFLEKRADDAWQAMELSNLFRIPTWWCHSLIPTQPYCKILDFDPYDDDVIPSFLPSCCARDNYHTPILLFSLSPHCSRSFILLIVLEWPLLLLRRCTSYLLKIRIKAIEKGGSRVSRCALSRIRPRVENLKIESAGSCAQTSWTNRRDDFKFTFKTKRSIRIIRDSE